jgi:hypothetical protein
VNLVSYQDGDKNRSVLYEGGLSEMYVPYQDPEETWNSHVFLDAGEYFTNTGSGGIIKPLLPASIARPTLRSSAGPSFTTTGRRMSGRNWPASLSV